MVGRFKPLEDLGCLADVMRIGLHEIDEDVCVEGHAAVTAE